MVVSLILSVDAQGFCLLPIFKHTYIPNVCIKITLIPIYSIIAHWSLNDTYFFNCIVALVMPMGINLTSVTSLVVS